MHEWRCGHAVAVVRAGSATRVSARGIVVAMAGEGTFRFKLLLLGQVTLRILEIALRWSGILPSVAEVEQACKVKLKVERVGMSARCCPAAIWLLNARIDRG